MVFLWFCIVLLAVGVVKHPGFGLGIWAQILIYFHITKGAKLAPKSNPKRAPKGAKEGQNQPQGVSKRGPRRAPETQEGNQVGGKSSILVGFGAKLGPLVEGKSIPKIWKKMIRTRGPRARVQQWERRICMLVPFFSYSKEKYPPPRFSALECRGVFVFCFLF